MYDKHAAYIEALSRLGLLCGHPLSQVLPVMLGLDCRVYSFDQSRWICRISLYLLLRGYEFTCPMPTVVDRRHYNFTSTIHTKA